jgi:tyrosine-protein kinase Etk/Wzc
MTPNRGDVALEVVAAPRSAEPTLVAVDQGAGPEDEMSFGEYLDILVRGRWLVLAAVLVTAAAGGCYALLATPIYRSDVLVQVEDRKADLGGLSDLSGLFGETSPAETEIEILRSRALTGTVVDHLGLDVDARPRRFPLIGGFLARHYDGGEPASALWGFRRYGWGGERLAISRLSVPEPLEAEKLTLVAGENGRYVLRFDGEPLLEGAVGATASGGGVELQVTDLIARPGTEFVVVHLPRDSAIENLQQDLRIAEKGKKTGILQLALEGPDRRQIAGILDALARAYLRQNVERKSAEAEKTLEFLESQLPALREKADVTERELERYRADHATMDVTLETQAAVQRAVELEKAASELLVEQGALRQRFTAEHPAMRAVQEKLARLDAERARLDARLKKLPEAELESARRLRDVKVANELYLTLLNKAQELKVVREGTIGNVRILDAALLPLKPVAPKRGQVVALSLVLGLAAGVALAFAKSALSHGVEDPEEVERATGVSVHAAIPSSEDQQEAARRAERELTRVPILAEACPKALAVESLRSLRTSLEFALLESTSNIVAIGGPAPSVGKSFVTVNLAHLLGESGKRVVVVDGDLRRGHLHHYFGVDRVKGLTDVLTGHATLVDAVRETTSSNVSFVATGTIPPNPAELLGSERFRKLLADLSGRFDVVLLDTPPVLAVTDAAILARTAGINLFVVRAGKHPIREIVTAVRQLARNGARVHGIIMNDVRIERGLGRKSAYHYQYGYE